MNTADHRPDFDAQARRLHDAALAATSEITLSRLRSARHQATRAPRHRNSWWLATACAALLAVGAGLHLVGQNPAGAGAGVQPATTTTVAQDAADSSDLLDQNPDLYVWLGSENALAME